VSSDYKVGPETDDEVCQSTLNLWRAVLPDAGIDKHSGRQLFQKRPERSDVDRDGITRGEQSPDAADVSCAHSVDPVQTSAIVKHGIGEGHAAPRRRGLRLVVDHNGAPLSEEPVRDGRPDVTYPTDHYLQPVQVHDSIEPRRMSSRLLDRRIIH